MVKSLRISLARHVITAPCPEPIAFSAGRMVTSHMPFATPAGYPDEFPQVINARPHRKDTIATLVSQRLLFKQVTEMLEIAAQPQSAKIMIEFDK